MRTIITALLPGLLLLLAMLSLGPELVLAEDQWVTSIQSSQEWAVFPCKNYLITNVCGTDKDYSDPGSLPATISVGDTITYTNKDGKKKTFLVRYISFFVYDRDINTQFAGERLTARKGDTSCFLFDVASRSDASPSRYSSKIAIKGCYLLR